MLLFKSPFPSVRDERPEPLLLSLGPLTFPRDSTVKSSASSEPLGCPFLVPLVTAYLKLI